ncbi:MAG: hypothetical protein QFX35_06175, partial [Candidatus Verstraetearchaeota archaeon]|nr:hypothetical protein [Candidatus Verstraetearchaeota archaeon]
DLENPMNYLKGLGIDEVMLTMAENITENKLKEFMEKRLETLVRTVVEGKLKETVNALIAEFMEKEAGSIIEGKIREMKEKGILKVPIDVEELRKALDEKLSEAINAEGLKESLKGELEDSLKKEIRSEMAKDTALLESLREELREQAGQFPSPPPNPAPLQAQPDSSSQSAIPRQENRRAAGGGISIVGITACASTLVRLFGRRGAERVVDDNYRLGRVSEDLRSSLIRAISIMGAGDMPDVPYERECGLEDHVMVTYLFDKLGGGGSDMDFLVLSNLLGESKKGRDRSP